jgi:hypothetical protein
MTVAPDLAQRFVLLASLLGEDGVPALEQLHQITSLLVLRLAQLPLYRNLLPKDCGWEELQGQLGHTGPDAFNLALIHMRDHVAPMIALVFDAARPPPCRAVTLRALMREVDNLPWGASDLAWLGPAYEGLLARHAALPRSPLAAHWTSPALRTALLAQARPTPEDLIVDPAAGLGCLLTAAAHAVRRQGDGWPQALAGRALGLVQRRDSARLGIANLLLNGLAAPDGGVTLRSAEALGPAGLALLPAPTLVVSDLAAQWLPLRRELALLRGILAHLGEESRAVLHVSAAVAGNGATARRLRAEFPQLALRALFTPAPDRGLILSLRKRAQPPLRPTPCGARQEVALRELVTECRHGLSTARQVDGEGTAMLRASGVTAGFIRVEDRCNVRVPESCTQSRLAVGDLLFVRNGPRRRVGVCAWVQSEQACGLLFPDKLIRMRVDTQRVLPEWIAACVNADHSRRVLEAAAIPSTGQYRVTRKLLMALRIPLPSVAEQRRLLGSRCAEGAGGRAGGLLAQA